MGFFMGYLNGFGLGLIWFRAFGRSLVFLVLVLMGLTGVFWC